MKPLTAGELRGWIVATATAHGWLVLHLEETNAGAPNLWLTRAGSLIVAQVKAERGDVTEAQAEWLTALSLVPNIEVLTVRPSSMSDVFARLSSANGAPVVVDA